MTGWQYLTELKKVRKVFLSLLAEDSSISDVIRKKKNYKTPFSKND